MTVKPYGRLHTESQPFSLTSGEAQEQQRSDWEQTPPDPIYSKTKQTTQKKTESTLFIVKEAGSEQVLRLHVSETDRGDGHHRKFPSNPTLYQELRHFGQFKFSGFPSSIDSEA